MAQKQRSDVSIVLRVVTGMFVLCFVVGLVAYLLWRLVQEPEGKPGPRHDWIIDGQPMDDSLVPLPADSRPEVRTAWKFVETFFEDGVEAALPLASQNFRDDFTVAELQDYREAWLSNSGDFAGLDARGLAVRPELVVDEVLGLSVELLALFDPARRRIAVGIVEREDGRGFEVESFEVIGRLGPLFRVAPQGLAPVDLAQRLAESIDTVDRARAFEFASGELRAQVTLADLTDHATALRERLGRFSGERPREVQDEPPAGAAEDDVATAPDRAAPDERAPINLLAEPLNEFRDSRSFELRFERGTAVFVLDLMPGQGGARLAGWSVRIDGARDLSATRSPPERARLFVAALMAGDLAHASLQCHPDVNADALARTANSVATDLGRVVEIRTLDRGGPSYATDAQGRMEVRREAGFTAAFRVTCERGVTEIDVEVAHSPRGRWWVRDYSLNAPAK